MVHKNLKLLIKLLFLLMLFVVFVFHLKELEKKSDIYEDELLKLEINNILDSIKIGDRESCIYYDEKEFMLTANKYGILWRYINNGDSILKKKGSLTFRIIKTKNGEEIVKDFKVNR